MKNRIALSFFGLLLFGLLSYSFFWDNSNAASSKNAAAAPNAAATGVFRGFVATDLVFSSTNKRVYLPEVDVIVRDLNNNIINQTQTNESGHYITKAVPMGTYLLCMEKSGFQNICVKVALSEPEHSPGPQILPLLGDSFIYGTALLEDGAVGFFNQSYYGISFHTDVKVSSTGDVFRCNVAGEFLIPYQPRKTRLTATCQAASVSKTVYAGNNVVDLVLPNNSPFAGEIFFHENGSEVHRTAPGAKLNVQADVSDPDGASSLTYQWFPWGNHPGFTSSNANNVNWTLPSGDGTYSIALVVTDGRGGISIKEKSIRAVDRQVLFSGTVRSLGTNGPVSDARVTVNGQDVLTGPNGFFSLSVPEVSNRRYILNISKFGLMAQSKVYFRDATGIDYNLVPNTTQKFSSDEPQP